MAILVPPFGLLLVFTLYSPDGESHYKAKLVVDCVAAVILHLQVQDLGFSEIHCLSGIFVSCIVYNKFTSSVFSLLPFRGSSSFQGLIFLPGVLLLFRVHLSFRGSSSLSCSVTQMLKF